MNPIRVTVPATSANLGPGFDAFGVALDLYCTVTVGPREDQRVVSTGKGADELPTDDGNLVWCALRSSCVRFGIDAPDITLHVDNAIPLERGLGSSAAAAVAGAALGRALAHGMGQGRGTAQGVGNPFADQDLIDLAAELEGHPDNAAAAVLGGIVVCHDGVATRLDPTDRLMPVLCVPTTRQSTQAARNVLPHAISLGDAAVNSARAAVVLAGLTGLTAWDPSAMRDVLHEPSRLAMMAESGSLIHALRAAGLSACLSGAGPSVLAVIETGDHAAIEMLRKTAGSQFAVRPSHWDRAGAMVTRRSSVRLYDQATDRQPSI
jgi:homoserine kinase